MDDMEVASGRKSEHTDDVHTDARELCLGGKLGSQVWVGRLEYVGDLFGNWSAPGVFAGNGHHVRGPEMEEEDTC